MKMKTAQGSIRPLSAAAPMARAGLLSLLAFCFFNLEKNDLRDGREHHLVDGEEKIRHLCTTNTGLCKNALEAEVCQVANIVIVGAVGESERVSPEEPLKGNYADGHHA